MINVSSIIPEIRVRIQDEGKVEIGDDTVLIPYINEAISWLNDQLIVLGDPSMIMEIDIPDNFTVPTGFVRFVGQHPLCQTGDTFKILDGSNLVSARYWANKQSIKSVEDAIDFSVQYSSVLVQYASIAAMNKLGKSAETSAALFKQLNDTLIQARKG